MIMRTLNLRNEHHSELQTEQRTFKLSHIYFAVYMKYVPTSVLNSGICNKQ